MISNKIPNKIHYCWFGGKEKPIEIVEIINNWRKIHPNFEIKEWNESNFDLTLYPYAKEAYEEKRYAFVTDVVRLHVLYNEGGIYMDTDVELIKPLSNFLDLPAFTGCEQKEFCVTGLMASIPRGKWIKSLLNDYKDKHFIVDGKPDLTTNTILITENTIKNFGWKKSNENQNLGDVVIFSEDYFCAKSALTGEITITENTHAIHHFSGSWITKKDKLKSKYMSFFKKIIVSIFGEDNFNKINSYRK